MKLNLANLTPRVIPSESPEVEQIVMRETRDADSNIKAQDDAINLRQPPRVESNVEGKARLSRLIDDDFPFDESQLAAINGMKSQRFACLTGAAGTGKTTCLKKLTDELQDTLSLVDMSGYFKSGDKDRTGVEDGDDYEMPEDLIPSICLCAFTGRASQMIKKNFPKDWHGNIMTIHRMLAYMPEWFEDIDPETDKLVNKMRFVPTYTSTFKLPWDIVIVDEAGMLGVDLWHNLLAAMKPGARLYMVGDINQLPPTHGKSVFGFAMAKWPSWELTHIHRQVGVNNSIVDNAWRVLKGQTPISDDPKSKDWKFVTMKLPEDVNKASQYVRAWLDKIRGNVYDPIRDSVITPINAYEQTQGYALGQDPLNRQLALMFNKSDSRYIIDAGRERKYFAIGDKVMATRNDYEAGITNGMTGIITNIARHGNYSGDTRRFDTIENVNRYLSESSMDEDEEIFSLEDLAGAIDTEKSAKERKEKEARDRGPASHIVTVKFGEGDHSFEIPFSTLAEVASLMTAYVVTCHKMQGGEAPFIVIICHQSHKRMLFREWLYTAITRGSQRVVVLYTPQGLASALNKQNIKGSTLAQKVEAFQALVTKGIAGTAMVVNIPETESLSTDLAPAKGRTIIEQGQEKSKNELMGLAQMGAELPIKAEPFVEPSATLYTNIEYECGRCGHKTKQVRIYCENCGFRMANVTESKDEPIDGGVIIPDKPDVAALEHVLRPESTRLLTYQPLQSQWGAVEMLLRLQAEQEKKLLTYCPSAPAVPVMKFKLPGLRLAGGK